MRTHVIQIGIIVVGLIALTGYLYIKKPLWGPSHVPEAAHIEENMGEWMTDGATAFPTPVKLKHWANQSILIENVGDSVIHNPRIFAESYPDTANWNSLISSISSKVKGNTERPNLAVLYELWRFFSTEITNVCSPGRNGTFIIDPVSLVRDYGYGCCSHTNRALAYLAGHLGIASRMVSTPIHEYSEILVDGRWEILDANLGMRWYHPVSGLPLRGAPTEDNEVNSSNAIGELDSAIQELPSGEKRELSGDGLAYLKKMYTEKIIEVTPWGFLPANRGTQFAFYPGDRLGLMRKSPIRSLQHFGDYVTNELTRVPPVGEAVLTTRYDAQRAGTEVNGEGNITSITMRLPFPLVQFRITAKNPMDPRKISVQTGSSKSAIGKVVGNIWTVTQKELANIPIDKTLIINLSGSSPVLTAKWTMQFNPASLRGRDGKNAELVYKDDSGFCRRKLRINQQILALGTTGCAPDEAKPVVAGFNLNRQDKSRGVVVKVYGGNLGEHGVDSNGSGGTVALLELPKKAFSYMTIKLVSHEDLEWSVRHRNKWFPLRSFQVGLYNWLRVGPEFGNQSGKIQLRASFRKALDRTNVILDHFSFQAGPQWIGNVPAVVGTVKPFR